MHTTYLDYFVKKIKKGELILNQNEFKDFLDIKTFQKLLT